MDSQSTLTISRPSSFIGSLIRIVLTIDNYSYELANGELLTFSLVPGHHVITYKVWCRRLKKIEIDVNEEKKYTIIFKPDFIWGGFKVAKESVLK